MDILFALIMPLISPFAAYPLLGLIVSGMFVYFASRKIFDLKSKIMLMIFAGLWALFSLSNYYWLNWRSPTGDWPIRVDLVLFGPPMLVITVIGVLVIIKRSR